QAILDNQLLLVTPDVGFNFTNFQAYMLAATTLPLTPVGNAYVVEGDTNEVYVGLTLAQSANIADYITYIEAFANVVSAAQISLTIDEIGQIAIASNETAGAIASLLNLLGAGTGTATTNLNVEVLTKNTPVALNQRFEPFSIDL